MKLVCFPHYTCGGLLCDIMNNTFSPMGEHNGIASYNHRLGKIGDTDSVQTNYNTNEFLNTIEKIKDPDAYIGTHIWPELLDTTIFDQVILITTSTSRSKLYRWLRVYYHYYSNTWNTMMLNNMERIDKERETAKNYLIPFLPVHRSNCYNIEFSEIVDNSVEFQKLICGKDYQRSLERWKNINDFLYKDFWNSTPARRFYEAELEQCLNKCYVYE